MPAASDGFPENQGIFRQPTPFSAEGAWNLPHAVRRMPQSTPGEVSGWV